MTELLTRTLNWIGMAATPTLVEQLGDYQAWLAEEATRAGGIGPGERDRLEERHVADSLLFAGVWDQSSFAPVIDVGSGAGLPGIPLAIVTPHRRFLLVDRSGRRVELLRRAIRVLSLGNVDVIQADIGTVDWSKATVVSRASLPPAALLGLMREVGTPHELLVAGSRTERPVVPGFETVEIPSEILDRPVWILRMAQT
ncbi:MAG: RsmG family class I SAM-dependent methyltransferase [Acidimicrobiia bacterium]